MDIALLPDKNRDSKQLERELDLLPFYRHIAPLERKDSKPFYRHVAPSGAKGFKALL